MHEDEKYSQPPPYYQPHDSQYNPQFNPQFNTNEEN